MNEFVKEYYELDDPMWVIGCIDSHGAIVARHAASSASGGLIMHTKDESKGKRWRWNIWGQEFHAAFKTPLHELTKEEYFLINDYLERKGYKKC